MKQSHRFLRVASLLGVSLVFAVHLAGQGTVNFANRVTGFVDAPVFGIDGITKLIGASYMAQLYAGATVNSMAPVGDPLPFRTGTGAGYINTSGVDPTRTIPGVAAGAVAFVKVVAWDTMWGATYETAWWSNGASSVFALTTGGGGVPPGPPANLVGLQSFIVGWIPEPSSMALGLLGAAVLFLRRRK